MTQFSRPKPRNGDLGGRKWERTVWECSKLEPIDYERFLSAKTLTETKWMVRN